MQSVMFWVPGIPQPKGSMRVVSRRRSRFGKLISANKNLAAWEHDVAMVAKAAYRGGPLLDCPIRLEMTFVVPKPAKPRWREPAVKPDIDKLCRAVMDGLTGVLWVDDSRVVYLIAGKTYGTSQDHPGVVVEVSF